MDCAVIHTWTLPVAGREKAALGYGVEVNEYRSNKAAEGKCSEPAMYFFSGRGMWMLRGDLGILRELYAGEEVQRLPAEGQFVLEDWEFEFAKTGEAATEHLLRYAAIGQEIGFV